MSKIKLKVVKPKAAPAEKKFHTVQCEECGKVFPMSHDDCHIGAYGCPWTTCPHCGKRTYVLCDEEEITLTEENFHYPQHFDKIDEHYVRKITDAEIEGMCKRTVKDI